MAKGYHTQALVLLLRDAVHAGAIKERLSAFSAIELPDRAPKAGEIVTKILHELR